MTQKTTKTAVRKTTKPAQPKTTPSPIAPNTIIELTIDAQTALEAYNKILRKKAKNLKTAGFRKGMAPLALAESILGQDAITEEALQAVVPAAYEEALKKSGKLPLTFPEFNPISLKKGEAWKLEAHVAEAPEIKLGNYQKTVQNAKKSAEKHEKELENEKKAQKSAEKTAASEKTTSSHDTAHKDAHAHTDHTLQHIYADLVAELKPQIPELLVRQEVRSELETLVGRLESLKLTLDGFLKERGVSFEQLSQDLAIQALGRLQLSFILEAIVLEQKFEATQADIDAAIAKTAVANKTTATTKSDPAYLNWLKQTIVRQKVVDHLLKI